jgi:hypothetical protein
MPKMQAFAARSSLPAFRRCGQDLIFHRVAGMLRVPARCQLVGGLADAEKTKYPARIFRISRRDAPMARWNLGV